MGGATLLSHAGRATRLPPGRHSHATVVVSVGSSAVVGTTARGAASCLCYFN